MACTSTCSCLAKCFTTTSFVSSSSSRIRGNYLHLRALHSRRWLKGPILAWRVVQSHCERKGCSFLLFVLFVDANSVHWGALYAAAPGHRALPAPPEKAKLLYRQLPTQQPNLSKWQLSSAHTTHKGKKHVICMRAEIGA
jgi:hypothetical protein